MHSRSESYFSIYELWPILWFCWEMWNISLIQQVSLLNNLNFLHFISFLYLQKRIHLNKTTLLLVRSNLPYQQVVHRVALWLARDPLTSITLCMFCFTYCSPVLPHMLYIAHIFAMWEYKMQLEPPSRAAAAAALHDMLVPQRAYMLSKTKISPIMRWSSWLDGTWCFVHHTPSIRFFCFFASSSFCYILWCCLRLPGPSFAVGLIM